MTPQEIKNNLKQNVYGKISPRHTETEHYYLLEDYDVVVPSVTSKIIVDKPHLRRWTAKVAINHFWSNKDKIIDQNDFATYLEDALEEPDRAKNFAAAVGSTAHKAIEIYLDKWIAKKKRPRSILDFIDKKQLIDYYSGEKLTIAEKSVFYAVKSAEELMIKRGGEPIASELLVGHPSYNTAGQLDLLWFNKDKELELWDWKTTNSVSDDYAMQVSVYAALLLAMSGIIVSRAFIMHLPKENKPAGVYEVKDLIDSLQAFISIAKVYDWQNNQKEKLVKDINRGEFIQL